MEGPIARVTYTVLNVMSLLLVGAGLVLLSTFFVGSPLPSSATTAEAVTDEEPATPVLAKNVKSKTSKEPVGGRQRGKVAAAEKQEGRSRALNIPEDKRLRITVPAMSRIENRVIPYSSATDEDAFRNHAAVHLRGTGNPWSKQANVYIAGHRLGYVGTPSFLAFWDLDKVDVGDKIYLTDSTGKRYVYKVFKDFVVDPTDLFVMRTLKGKNIVTLQTCTLPDYSRRLIVQAERVA